MNDKTITFLGVLIAALVVGGILSVGGGVVSNAYVDGITHDIDGIVQPSELNPNPTYEAESEPVSVRIEAGNVDGGSYVIRPESIPSKFDYNRSYPLILSNTIGETEYRIPTVNTRSLLDFGVSPENIDMYTNPKTGDVGIIAKHDDKITHYTLVYSAEEDDYMKKDVYDIELNNNKTYIRSETGWGVYNSTNGVLEWGYGDNTYTVDTEKGLDTDVETIAISKDAVSYNDEGQDWMVADTDGSEQLLRSAWGGTTAHHYDIYNDVWVSLNGGIYTGINVDGEFRVKSDRVEGDNSVFLQGGYVIQDGSDQITNIYTGDVNDDGFGSNFSSGESASYSEAPVKSFDVSVGSIGTVGETKTIEVAIFSDSDSNIYDVDETGLNFAPMVTITHDGSGYTVDVDFNVSNPLLETIIELTPLLLLLILIVIIIRGIDL